MPDTCYAPGRDPPGGTGGDELFALSGVSPARLFTSRAHHRGHIHTAFPGHGPQPSPQRESLGRTVLRTGAGTASSHQTPTQTPGSLARRPPGGGRRAAESWRVGCGASCGRLTRRPAARPQTHVRESHGGRARPLLRPWEGPPCRHTPSPASSGRWLLLDPGRSPGRAHTVVMTLRAPGWNLRIFLLSAREALTRHSLGFGGRAGAGCRGRARGRAGRPPPPPTRASPSLPLDSPSPKRSVV